MVYNYLERKVLRKISRTPLKDEDEKACILTTK
jgi:hypothetical protein